MIPLNALVSISAIKPSQCKHFSCGILPLDEFLSRYARRNDRKNVSKTFVFLHDNVVAGYYTVNCSQIEYEILPKGLQEGLPSYPLPTIRLCQLAVDQRLQGNRIGEHLLMDVIKRTLRVAQEVAIYAIVVDAKDERAKRFYMKYDFIPLVDQPLKLILPIHTLQELSEC